MAKSGRFQYYWVYYGCAFMFRLLIFHSHTFLRLFNVRKLLKSSKNGFESTNDGSIFVYILVDACYLCCDWSNADSAPRGIPSFRWIPPWHIPVLPPGGRFQNYYWFSIFHYRRLATKCSSACVLMFAVCWAKEDCSQTGGSSLFRPRHSIGYLWRNKGYHCLIQCCIIAQLINGILGARIWLQIGECSLFRPRHPIEYLWRNKGYHCFIYSCIIVQLLTDY